MGKKFMGYDNASELITAIGTKIKAKYTKPNTGIPKTDLASAVQTSLGKADSALQSETDPTVPAWAKETNKPSYTQDEVSDGTTYKRVRQTEKNAWSGKQNALTTTQMNAVNSGIDSTKVAQISTNQSNILYALNRTGKNLLRELPTQTINGVTLTNNGDGTYTITRTATSTDSASFIFGNNDNGRLTGCKMTGGASGYGLKSRTASGAQVNVSTDWTTAVTISATAIGNITINVGSSENPQNVQIRPFACDAEMYEKDPSFTMPALPNYDLTRLEAEDRAGLIDVVDGGAKNLAEIPTTQTIGSITFTKDSNEWITSNLSTPDGRQWSDAKKNVVYSVKAGRYIIYGETASTNTGAVEAYVIVNGNLYKPLIITANSNGTVEVNLTSAGTIGLMYKPYSSNKVRYMVCTKAAFGVSSKFVPYRPNWDAIQAAITPSTFAITGQTGITISDLDTRKCNGVAWFSMIMKSNRDIAVDTNTSIATIEAATKKKSGALVVFNAVVSNRPEISAMVWISGTTNLQTIQLRTDVLIPANTLVYITGSYLY